MVMTPMPRSSGSPSCRSVEYEHAAQRPRPSSSASAPRSSTAWSQAEREKLGLVEDDGRQGRAISLPEPEPWPTPIDGAALLDGMAEAIGRYVIMSDHARFATALWVVHTFLLDCFGITPRLAVRSPMKRCGKTTLLDVLSRLVLRPLPTGSVTAAALFRVVEGYRPTLLVDEADTFLSEADELRGVLNSGHRKGGQVVRTVGDDHEPRAFSTFAAVTIAIIGNLPDTLGRPLGHRRSQAAHAEREGRVVPIRSGRPSWTCWLGRRRGGRRTTPAPSPRPTPRCRASTTAKPTTGLRCSPLPTQPAGHGLSGRGLRPPPGMSQEAMRLP